MRMKKVRQSEKKCWSGSSSGRPFSILTFSQGQSINQHMVILPRLRDEKKFVAGQIVSTSLRKCCCSQRSEHPVVLGREKYDFTVTTSQFTWSCSVGLYLFPKLKGTIKRVYFEGVEAIKSAQRWSWVASRKILPTRCRGSECIFTIYLWYPTI